MTFHVKQGWAERADHKTGVFHVKRRGAGERVFHVKLAGWVLLREFVASLGRLAPQEPDASASRLMNDPG